MPSEIQDSPSAITSSADFKLKFDGRLKQINANTLAASLFSVTAIVHEINRTVAPETAIDVNVKAFSGGSFLVHLDLEAVKAALPLVAMITPVPVKDVVDVLVAIFDLRKFLKGEPPKAISPVDGKVQIENNNGQITIAEQVVYNIYGDNATVQQALANNFKALDEDPAVTGYEITDGGENPLIQIDREEFADLANDADFLPADSEDPRIRIISERANLGIIRPAFDARYKWDFQYRTQKITARVLDAAFQARIDSGEAFHKGDRLVVDLEISQEFDNALNGYLDKAFRVAHVIQHIPREQQPDLFNPESD
ncbi:MAG: hypothetical protein JST22_09895 [Bacteroidetes bacterium]|nr:hypothetical protein [Bacteroidota bacterium]